MDGPDGIDIESLRVDPALMRQVMEQQAWQVKGGRDGSGSAR